MKVSVCAVGLALCAGLASADVYNDSTGELFDNGFTHLDIVSVTVTNDASNLHFSIQTAGNLDVDSWGNYMIALDYLVGGAEDNPWGPRPINFGAGVFIDAWIGTWANDGGSDIGGQVWTWPGFWNNAGGLSGTDASQHAAGRQVFSVALADLGLSVGQTIYFDVMSSGSGANDAGVDHLSRANQSMNGWGSPSFSGQFLAYTLIPTPSTAALLGLGGLVALRRRR